MLFMKGSKQVRLQKYFATLKQLLSLVPLLNKNQWFWEVICPLCIWCFCTKERSEFCQVKIFIAEMLVAFIQTRHEIP